MTNFIAWWQSGILFGTVIMLGALGEIITQKAGHLNLGVPGLMFLGGFAGFASGFLYGNTENPNGFLLILIPIVVSVAASGLGGLLYSFLTVTLKANQNVTGLALTYVGVGIGSFGGQFITNIAGSGTYERASAASELFTASIAKSAELTDPFSQMFLSYGFMAYLAIVMAVVAHFILKKSRVGLNLRAIGESPATADAAGINVNKYKYLATIIGAAISGLGGMFYVLVYSNGGWATTNSIEALGWLSVALVIFATWRPLNAIWGSYLFALLYWFYAYSSVINLKLTTPQSDLLQMLPYVVTLLVLIFISFRKKKENQPPASLGLNYFREDR